MKSEIGKDYRLKELSPQECLINEFTAKNLNLDVITNNTIRLTFHLEAILKYLLIKNSEKFTHLFNYPRNFGFFKLFRMRMECKVIGILPNNYGKFAGWYQRYVMFESKYFIGTIINRLNYRFQRYFPNFQSFFSDLKIQDFATEMIIYSKKKLITSQLKSLIEPVSHTVFLPFSLTHEKSLFRCYVCRHPCEHSRNHSF